MKKMMLVFAHPDDESFTCGGIIPKYVANGWKVELLCATRGEAGGNGPYSELSPEALGAQRARELDAAAKILGINRVSFLGYFDGTLAKQQLGEIEDRIYRKFIEFCPDVVITFDTTGISNHPDHIKLTYATTYAFQNYASEIYQTRQFVARVSSNSPSVKKRHFLSQHKFALKQESFADVVDGGSEPKLYYTCMPESIATFLKKNHVIPIESFGKPWKGVPDKIVTTIIDISRYSGTKIKALGCHVSQERDVQRFLSDPTKELLRHEYFILRMQGITEVFMGKNDRVRDRL